MYRPTTELSAAEMVSAAAARLPVRLASGRTARLVRWGASHGSEARLRRRRSDARVEFPSGARATVPAKDVLGVIYDATHAPPA